MPDVGAFSESILKYFLEFLETDFKRQQSPRRKITLRNDSGFRTAFALRKYPTLYSSVMDLLASPNEGSFTLKIPRHKFKAPISSTLKDLIDKHVQAISESSFAQIREVARKKAKATKNLATTNPESYIEGVLSEFVNEAGEKIIAPLLGRLDEIFRTQSYSAIESAFEVESDLMETICAKIAEHLPKALNTYVVSGSLDEVEMVLNTFFDSSEVKDNISCTFRDLATSDSFSELRDVVHYLNTGLELQLYLYVCDVKFEDSKYPIFYLPGKVTYNEKATEYLLEFDPHLYVNRRAIDYILAKQATAAARLSVTPIERRITFLSEHEIASNTMADILGKLVPAFDLPGAVRLGRDLGTQSTTTLRMTSNAYFSVFDKADEALLNDYEEMLVAIRENQREANDLFQGIMQAVLFEEPVSVAADVEKAWEETSIPERLVAEAPIPINEEQQKILKASMNDKCRFIAVEGPPGTGKSHTITAIAFNCILNDRSVLILSDKKEALDVVEDKLSQTLSSVRHTQDGQDFPNPILRLGKSGTFPQLIKKAALSKIQQFTTAHKSRKQEIDVEKNSIEADLKEKIETTTKTLSSIHLKDMEILFREEEAIEAVIGEIVAELRVPVSSAKLAALDEAINHLPSQLPKIFSNDLLVVTNLAELIHTLPVYGVADTFSINQSLQKDLALFTTLDEEQYKNLLFHIAQYEKLNWPLFGFFFTKSKARAIDSLIGCQFPSVNPHLEYHKQVPALKRVAETFGKIRNKLSDENIPTKFQGATYQILAHKDPHSYAGAAQVLKVLSLFSGAFGKKILKEIKIGHDFSTPADGISFCFKVIRYATAYADHQTRLESLPVFDYVGEKAKLESLHTINMANRIDRCFLDFVENNRAKAQTVAGLIKSKKQFPQEEFEGLKKAFPCIIASIREFGEYVPLHKEIFDIVVIDEASQVSVAQAFPALLRTKKVIVFGDQNQFSNVKSMQASNSLNDAYLRQIDQAFKQNIQANAATIQRLQQFDVKKSILEFFGLIANYSIMLRKHFRGYQELISFSSKNFYNGQLQAIKLRGKPLEEVIQFTVVAPPKSGRKNTNLSEIDFILSELVGMIDDDISMSVGIITPFREQQQLIQRTLFAHGYADEFESRLSLKVMTFDSCQGEERDIIYYSMVATEASDLLNYIFPVSLEKALEEDSGHLKRQRLNVGFSRAKECIHFVLSKPPDKFHGSIGRTLLHFHKLLNDSRRPDASETDPLSPMEGKVLDWILKCNFFTQNEELIELIPQFPIGEYLRQLDPLYQHPAYRCDFLLRYYGKCLINIVIEYDGFMEHFKEHGKVHTGNYDRYYKEEDVERQMVLESYGYKFLRLNRFNLGKNPIDTISQRLENLVKGAQGDKRANSSEKLKEVAENIANGNSKTCPKCGLLRETNDYYDPSLKNGAGGYGRNCMQCKQKISKPSNKYSRRRGYYRRWRY